MPIYVDSRGKGEKEISDILISKHYPVELTHIESGDYVIEDIGIERKTVSDLLSTLYGTKGHSLWDQIKVLKDTYKKSLLIIEGYVDEDDKLLNAVLYGILVGWQLPIIFTTDTTHTANRIGKIFDKYGKTRSVRIPPPAVKKASTVKEIKWCMLQTIPHIGGVVARRILDNFPEVFSMDKYGPNYKNSKVSVKGLNKDSKELLIRVLCNES